MLITASSQLPLASTYSSSSLPTAPGNPPRNLQLLSLLGRSVDLLWYGPVNDSLLGGPLTGYKVRVSSTSTGRTEEHNTPQTISGQSGPPLTFTVAGLKPVTEYGISVAAVNVFGVGVFTPVVLVTTAEAGKLSGGECSKVRGANCDSMALYCNHDGYIITIIAIITITSSLMVVITGVS